MNTMLEKCKEQILPSLKDKNEMSISIHVNPRQCHVHPQYLHPGHALIVILQNNSLNIKIYLKRLKEGKAQTGFI